MSKRVFVFVTHNDTWTTHSKHKSRQAFIHVTMLAQRQMYRCKQTRYYGVSTLRVQNKGGDSETRVGDRKQKKKRQAKVYKYF